ncbi:TSUP family transporter [Comamonadaceae bacterium SL12-8]|uniref:TSUP family transporter n=2 Tax=Amphibiibacter pelophylacis TaxID=1799477 RepID=A0ACC6P122_9BURK
MLELIFITLASGLAGFIDAIVGGGGLVLVPALFAAFPTTEPATLLGTNKSASVWGTGMAAWQYSRRVPVRWRALGWGAAAAALASFAGAWALTLVSADALRRLLPVILLVVFVYTLVKKDLGQVHAPRYSGRREAVLIALIGAATGFYDGFFGPGTGSFMVFLLVRVLGYDFLGAAMGAKVLNVATNLAALLLLGAKGHVWWQMGLVMAVANVAGSVLGSRLALRKGAGFVRGVFIVVVGVLIVKAVWDGWLKTA